MGRERGFQDRTAHHAALSRYWAYLSSAPSLRSTITIHASAKPMAIS